MLSVMPTRSVKIRRSPDDGARAHGLISSSRARLGGGSGVRLAGQATPDMLPPFRYRLFWLTANMAIMAIALANAFTPNSSINPLTISCHTFALVSAATLIRKLFDGKRSIVHSIGPTSSKSAG